MIEYAIHLLDKLLGDSYGEETEEIRNSLKLLKNSAFGMVKIEEIKAFVETYQKLLLENKKKQEGQNSNDKILDYLETYFFDCLNDKLPLSELGRKRQMAENSIYIEKLSSNVKPAVPEKLYKVLLPVLEPQNNPEYSVHFSRYLPHFLRRWKLDMDHLGDRLTVDDIINFMVSINFNSTGFFKYLTDEILSDSQAQENPNLQEEILTSKLYRFKQVQNIIGYPFDPDLKHIKSVLEDWLKIELAKCKAKQKRFDPSQLQIFSSKTKKLEMNLSVAQIAYFFRLLNGANIIANKVKKDIFTVIINNFSSQKVETIELSSVRNKFYYAETKTVESVKDMLKTLLKEADKPDDPTFLLEQ